MNRSQNNNFYLKKNKNKHLKFFCKFFLLNFDYYVFKLYTCIYIKDKKMLIIIRKTAGCISSGIENDHWKQESRVNIKNIRHKPRTQKNKYIDLKNIFNHI